MTAPAVTPPALTRGAAADFGFEMFPTRRWQIDRDAAL